MKEFDNLKAIWDQQNQLVIPNVSHIIQKAKRAKKAIKNKIIIQVIALLLAMINVIVVLCVINFKMATTFIGIAITLFTIFAYSAVRIYQVKQLNNINLTQSPQTVLQQLNVYCTFDKILRTKGMLLYFILLNFGMALYFIEVLKPMSLNFKILSLLIYLSWMLIAYFVIGKKQLKKDEEKMNFLINSIQNLENEYKNE